MATQRTQRHEPGLLLYHLLLTLSTVLIITALAVAAIFYGGRYLHDRQQEQAAQTAIAEQERITARKRDQYLRQARDYNRRLYEHPRAVGAIVDPFSGKTGSFTGADDRQYARMLPFADGIMATLQIPRLHLELPIRHGASPAILQNGLGHLPGTSLPVGGTNTRAVITGHRGLAGATLFTNLPRLTNGDLFYITVYGQTLAYRVAGQKVIRPTDVRSLTIVPGKDLVTLMTCTPLGINSERLLVTGERTPWPPHTKAPDTGPAPGQIVLYAFTAVAACWLGLFVYGRRGTRPDIQGLHILRPAAGRDGTPDRKNR